MTLRDAVHSGAVARRTNDLTVSRRAVKFTFISATNAYRRGIFLTLKLSVVNTKLLVPKPVKMIGL